MGLMKKKVLFIMGAGHSGSSLLALILGSHPQCFSAGELQGLPNRYGKNLYIDCVNCNSQFWEETFGEAGLKKLADGLADARLNKYVPLKVEKVIRGWLGTDEVFNPYSFMLSQLQKDVIIDASKSYEWIKKKIKGKEFKSGKIEGYLLHLVRDGRAVVNSYLRKYPSKDMAKLTQHWVEKTKERQAFFAVFESSRRMEVAYEELASKPDETVKKICNFIGIEFRPDMIEYWKFPHHDISGNDGTYSLVRRYQEKEALAKVREIHGDYYDRLDLGIKLDLRWQQELLAEKLEVFNRIAGEFNKPYEWNG